MVSAGLVILLEGDATSVFVLPSRRYLADAEKKEKSRVKKRVSWLVNCIVAVILGGAGGCSMKWGTCGDSNNDGCYPSDLVCEVLLGWRKKKTDWNVHQVIFYTFADRNWDIEVPLLLPDHTNIHRSQHSTGEQDSMFQS